MQESNDQPGKTEESVTTGTDWGKAVLESLEKNLADETEDSTEQLQVESPESEDTDSETEQDSSEQLEPLEQWNDESKELFATLGNEAQKFLLDKHKEIEGGFTSKFQELAEERKRFESINEVLSPYEAVLKQQGQPLAPVLAQALNLLSSVTKDPAAAVKQAIQAYRLTPEQLGFGGEEDLTDPTVKAQNERIANLEYRLTQQSQGVENKEQQAGQSELDAFSKATNEDGSLKNPHFEAVRLHMAPLVDSGKTLDEAYKEAVYIVPEYREAQAKAASDLIKKEVKEASEEKRKVKVKKAKAGETLAISDVDTEEVGKPKFTNWEDSVRHTLSQMEQ